MKLFDFLSAHKYVCEDTCDTIFDAIVTIDWDKDYKPSEEYKELEKFTTNIYKAVDFVEVNKGGVWIVDWSGFIKNNLDKFKEFSKKYWYQSIEDWGEDDLIYEWINELHKWLAGYATEIIYKNFNDMFFS
jgi:hypothetical protein